MKIHLHVGRRTLVLINLIELNTSLKGSDRRVGNQSQIKRKALPLLFMTFMKTPTVTY